ncbi:MAG: nucleotidyltransferase domain-containing protein [DPANN group archaeon]|nr:nucleotidyltransferase domain-containing protein [DPANN group archaeon]
MVKIKILKFLLNNRENRFTIKKISESLKINYRTAYENVLLLEKEKLIKITKTGNSNICELDDSFNESLFTAEFQRKKDLLNNKDFQIIHNRLSELKFPFIILLFGSYSKGTNNKHSDIDLLSIGGDQKEIKSVISLLPDKIHLTQINYEEFIAMAKSKEFTVISEILKNNIILIGIEEYYRLLKNVR